MSDFLNGDVDDFDDFQELLDGITINPVETGKRGRKSATNNIGADVLGVPMLEDLLTNYRIDFVGNPAKGIAPTHNLKDSAFTLFGVIDAQSVRRAKMISRNIKPIYNQVGVLAVSLAKDQSGNVIFQWWKGTVVNNVLTFQKVFSPSKDFVYKTNPQGIKNFWSVDKNGNYKVFPWSELVDFEVYLNAIVTETEVPVSFPSDEVSKLKGLSQILAGVNTNSTSVVEVNNNDEDDEVGE